MLLQKLRKIALLAGVTVLADAVQMVGAAANGSHHLGHWTTNETKKQTKKFTNKLVNCATQ